MTKRLVGAVGTSSAACPRRGGRVLCVHGDGSVHAPSRHLTPISTAVTTTQKGPCKMVGSPFHVPRRLRDRRDGRTAGRAQGAGDHERTPERGGAGRHPDKPHHAGRTSGKVAGNSTLREALQASGRDVEEPRVHEGPPSGPRPTTARGAARQHEGKADDEEIEKERTGMRRPRGGKPPTAATRPRTRSVKRGRPAHAPRDPGGPPQGRRTAGRGERRCAYNAFRRTARAGADRKPKRPRRRYAGRQGGRRARRPTTGRQRGAGRDGPAG